jgi:histidinol dehydrogenase
MRIGDLRAFQRDVARFRAGGAFGDEARAAAERIVRSVRRGGDAAVLASVRRFDRPSARAADLLLGPAAIRRTARGCPAEVRRALDFAYRRIRAFHERQRPSAVRRVDANAAVALLPVPLRRVGALVPRGTVAYPSTALMTGVPAQVAGVRELVIASPMPADGRLDPALAHAATLVGASAIYRAGGAGAVAALAYGTERLERVDKIVGPGNAYATAAKWLVSADVGIDAFAGPSELVVVASGDADAAPLVLDLLAQVEHGSGAFAALISNDAPLLEAVAQVLRRLGPPARIGLYRAPRLAAAAEAADEAAPEHVLLAGRGAAALAGRLTRAGALFIGAQSAVAFGDYVAGANHSLPTGGAARWSSALRVADCMRWTSRVELRGDLRRLARSGAIVSRYERMEYHAASLEVRT